MKILYITSDLLGNDGWGRYGLNIAETLKGRDVLWIVSKKSENNFKQKILLAEPLRYLSDIFLIIITARKINIAIKNFAPDVIHFLVEPYLTILPLLNIKRTKILCTVHGTYSFLPNVTNGRAKNLIFLWWMKFAYNRIDNIVAVSNHTKMYLIKCLKKFNIQNVMKKITVIGNGVDFKNFHHSDEKGGGGAVKQILFVGAVKSRKGLREAVTALKFYHDNFSNDFIYNIIGEYDENDKYYQDLKSLIKSCKLEDKIIFQGKVDEQTLHNYYLKSDLFLMLPTSDGNKFEGFGLVYLEANASGVSCITSKNCGAEDAVLDGKTGYVVNYNIPEEVAQKIDLILNKKTIKPIDCFNWAKQNDIKIKVEELLALYLVK